MPAFKVVEVRRTYITLSACAIALVAAWFLIGSAMSSNTSMHASEKADYLFETVQGFFWQDDPATQWVDFDFTKHDFGLVDRQYDTDVPGETSSAQWSRFDRYVRHLVATAPPGVTYKVLYMGRHGQGDHNVAESFYGTKAWDDYWSKLEGNGTVVWADAHLTAVGKEQVLAANAFMRGQLTTASMPAPRTYYVSPLYRCLETANLTFSGLDLPVDAPFKPIIKELLREVMGEHTCDRRSTRTYIHQAFPEWSLEPGFSETDELWQADHRETWTEHDRRTRKFLTELFDGDSGLYVSLTSHSGAIASKLRVLGHREFRLPTGGMIPVLVKASK